MWCDKAEWVGTRKNWFWDRAKIKQIFFWFVWFCFCNPSSVRIFETNWPISMGSLVQDNFANDVYNQSEKYKLNLSDFRLILLGCITNQQWKCLCFELHNTITFKNVEKESWIYMFKPWSHVYKFPIQTILIKDCISIILISFLPIWGCIVVYFFWHFSILLHIQVLPTGYAGLILCSTVVATAGWSTFEGSMRALLMLLWQELPRMK